MEKYTRFRDRGTGITPFLPVNSESRRAYLPLHLILFILRLPFLVIGICCLLLLQWLPFGLLFKKIVLWMILGILGLWWIDLQIDRVKKGTLAKDYADKLPGPSDLIVSSFASPVDALYLAALFDPIFTASYPHTKQVREISLLQAISRALANPEEHPPKNATMTDISTLVAKNRKRIIAVFPECTTTNGTGILPLSPCLHTSPSEAKIFPINLRYTPSDITTPVPGYFSFLWKLLSQPSHSIRVRIAESMYNNPPAKQEQSSPDFYQQPASLPFKTRAVASRKLIMSRPSSDDVTGLNENSSIIDDIENALARLGRVRRVRLSLRDKIEFIEAWN
ncbi:hypothetical protein K3495_g12914 [Podosphaera aphanis]|nr:hypothetical protein K3495_g12914 [Podosphaera aphanis]